MNYRIPFLRLTSAFFFVGLFAATLVAQTESVADLRDRMEQEFAGSNLDELDLLAPRQFNRAQDSRDAALKLIEGNREESLIRIKLQHALEELEASRRAAGAARKTFGDALIEREAARDARADSLSPESWKRAENLLSNALRKFEQRGSTGQPATDDIIGTYRAARLEATRTQVLGPARARLQQAEQRGAEKQFPTLLLRANQALGLAEANLSQGKIEEAQDEAETAEKIADRTLALLAYVESAQRARNSWEAALLPYEDLLDELAAYLDGELDASKCGAAHRDQLLELIDSQFDSLETLAADQKSMLDALEQSLAETQTGLSDAQNRIRELENRVETVEDQRTSAREALQTRAETAERITRAQDTFKAGEAVVLQNADGTVTIRLQGLKFAAGATALTKIHRRLLDRAVVAIAQFPGTRIRVEGHTDSGGGAEINQMLSESRAQHVAEYLTRKMKKLAGKIESVGFGESRPLVSNNTVENRKRNRRIDVVLVLQ